MKSNPCSTDQHRGCNGLVGYEAADCPCECHRPTFADLNAELESLMLRYQHVAVIAVVAGKQGATVHGDEGAFHLTDDRLVVGNHDDFVELFTPTVMRRMREMQAEARKRRQSRS